MMQSTTVRPKDSAQIHQTLFLVRGWGDWGLGTRLKYYRQKKDTTKSCGYHMHSLNPLKVAPTIPSAKSLAHALEKCPPELALQT